MSCDVYLQIALDYTTIEEAIGLAHIIPDHEWIMLEAGTPLIKAEGMRSISLIKKIAGRRLVVADLKTMDTGSLEASLAFNNGADIVSILALAPEETIRGAVKEAHDRNKQIMADLIGVSNPVEMVNKLESLDVDFILYHIGIDVQKGRGLTVTDRAGLVRDLKEKISIARLAVAGGIKPRDAGLFKDAGADVIIIGSAITKSENPLGSIEEFIRSARPTCG